MPKLSYAKIIKACLLLAAAVLPVHVVSGSSRDYAVELSASIRKDASAIELKWLSLSKGDAFSVARKEQDSPTWTVLANLPAGVLRYTDHDVQAGRSYEYRVALNPLPARGGTGYILAGIDAELIDHRGRLILLLDSTHATALTSELSRLERDFIGDGWEIARLEVSRTESVVAVKAKIKALYELDPLNTKALFIFGHVPVPYSGNYTADGHSDHRGAWPADMYYADMDGIWTDITVNNSSATRAENRNIPGDGKFDQSNAPSEVELQVGRVDMFKMGSYDGKPEVELLRGYLNKLHQFRHGRNPLPRRGFVTDNFGEMNGEAFAASGWRNFAPFFGSENIQEGAGNTYFPTLEKEGYLFSYACGGGAYDYCSFVGGTGDFRRYDYKSAFTMVLGSYFGDWDADTSFLRGAIASPTYGLAAVWAGRPHWFLHHMAMGETIGHSTRLNQNNGIRGTYHPQQYAGGVHIALMGDPTLRLHPVIPPADPRAIRVGTQVQVVWSPSSDENIAGYHVYRAASPNGPYNRLTSSPVANLAFMDDTNSGEDFYQVRAVKLESSASGTYYNQSQGVFTTNVAASNQSKEPRLAIRNDSGNHATLTFNSEIGRTYRVLGSIDFEQWLEVQEVTALMFETSVQVRKEGAFRFFKVEAGPSVVPNPIPEPAPGPEPPPYELPGPETM